MSSFKRLKKSDVFTIPYVANKNWKFELSDSGSSDWIKIYEGQLSVNPFSDLDPITINGYYETLVYRQINHTYYQAYSQSYSTQSLMFTTTNYESASGVYPSGSFYQFGDPNAMIKDFPTAHGDTIQIISVPKEIYGERILPGTFQVTSSAGLYKDDSRGNIYIGTNQIGNIFYEHGNIIITDTAYQVFWYPVTMSFQNQYTVYENYITCTVEESEYNLTYNPSLLSDLTAPSSSVKDFATGSDFNPYVTTVGLYNDKNELLMVAKLAQPMPISSETDMTIMIKYDT